MNSSLGSFFTNCANYTHLWLGTGNELEYNSIIILHSWIVSMQPNPFFKSLGHDIILENLTFLNLVDLLLNILE